MTESLGKLLESMSHIAHVRKYQRTCILKREFIFVQIEGYAVIKGRQKNTEGFFPKKLE